MLTEVMAAALAAKLLASAQGALPQSIEPAARPQATLIYDPVTCVAVNKREARSPFHVFACADVVFSGDVTGAVRPPAQPGGLNGSRLFLKSEARLKRTDAQGPNHEYAAYADTVIWVPSLGTNNAATGTGAYFFFGLQGTTAKSTNNPAVTVQAFGVATLETSTTASVQCVDEACSAPIPVLGRSFNPTSGFRLRLRSDVAIVAPTAPTGYDAEAIADFDDTLELLAIQIVDDQDRPVPCVTPSCILDGGLQDPACAADALAAGAPVAR